MTIAVEGATADSFESRVGAHVGPPPDASDVASLLRLVTIYSLWPLEG